MPHQRRSPLTYCWRFCIRACVFCNGRQGFWDAQLPFCFAHPNKLATFSNNLFVVLANTNARIQRSLEFCLQRLFPPNPPEQTCHLAHTNVASVNPTSLQQPNHVRCLISCCGPLLQPGERDPAAPVYGPVRAAQVLEVLCRTRAFVVKKLGQVDGDDDETRRGLQKGQVTWNKFKGPVPAWEEAKKRANFK